MKYFCGAAVRAGTPRRNLLLIAALAFPAGALGAPSVLPTGTNLRIVSYNVDADTSSSSGIKGVSATVVKTVLQAIGNESLAGHSQPIDVLALQELEGTSSNSLSPTLSLITNDLNAIYGAGTYAFDSTPDPTDGPTATGNGPSGLIYNTHTVQDKGAHVVASPAKDSDPRAPIRYTLQAAGYGAASQFYVYVDHYKASGGTSNQSVRANEAVLVRSDADSLPANSHIIYTGDFNLAGRYYGDHIHSGSAEQAYQNLVAPAGANLIDGNGNNAGVAVATGQAFDPLDPSESFVSNTGDYEYLFTEAGNDLTARFDMQLVSSPMQSGSDAAGFQVVPETQTAFGNNTWVNGVNTTALSYTTTDDSTASVAWSGNTALADLSNRTTVLYDLTQLTDHLPMVSDYSLLLVPGDANGDGAVNSTDASILSYGQAHGLTGWTHGDFNGDGVINSDDWSLFSLGLAMMNSSSPVPEPGTIAIMALCGPAALTRRRSHTRI